MAMRKILISLVLSLVGLLTGVIGVEILFRIFEWRGAKSQVAWSDRPAFYFQHEGSATLQDFNYQKQKPPNTFRIAVVGDSFSFAPYMQFTDAFPKKLEQMLNLNSTALRAEVLNYGVPGYSTSHEIAKVDEAISQGTDLIILQIT